MSIHVLLDTCDHGNFLLALLAINSLLKLYCCWINLKAIKHHRYSLLLMPFNAWGYGFVLPTFSTLACYRIAQISPTTVPEYCTDVSGGVLHAACLVAIRQSNAAYFASAMAGRISTILLNLT